MDIQGLFRNRAALILASGSPRRQDFLTELGIEFTVIVPSIAEVPSQDESPWEFALRIASEKARVISRPNPDSWVLAADTIVVLDNEILGKPADPAEAGRMLSRLAGRRHEVLTGFYLRNEKESCAMGQVVETEVFFSPFSIETAAAYVATGEPLDKAGSYGIQGQGGALVEKISGSYSNVVGLPLAEVVAELLRFGVIALRQ